MKTGPDALQQQTVRGSTKRVNPSIGDRYGELTVAEFIGVRDSDRSKMWLLRCDCGGEAIRSTGHLNRNARDMIVQSCRQCRSELRVGQRVAQSKSRGEFWAWLFRRCGTVWPASSCDRLSRRIAEDLAADGHREPVPSVGEVTIDPPGSTRAYHFLQRIDALYPLRSAVKFWKCAECGAVRSIGFACTDCIDFVCVQCVRDERHAHYPDGSMSLDAVGAYFEVSRERVRQMEGKALRKMRHPSRRQSFTLHEDEDIASCTLRRAAILSALAAGYSRKRIARGWGVDVDFVRRIEEADWWRNQVGEERRV